MSGRKHADLSSSLLAVKGKATASADAKGRSPEDASADSGTATLNFKVSSDFRQRFRLRAAEADLKLNELLPQALEAWEEKHLVKP